MNYIKKTFVLVLLLSAPLAFSQQLPQFTQFMFNTISINPAYAGSRETLNLTALHRNQWAGIDGNPVTSTISIHSPLRNDRVGVGLSYIGDGLGDEKTNYFYGDFSYSVPLSEEVKLSFGLKAGFTNYQFINPDPNDPVLNNTSVWNPNIGAGLYVGSNRWYFGLSSPRILNYDLNETEFTALERNSYYAIAGLVFDLSSTIKFKPTAITKFTNGAPATYDLTANFLFNEKFWLGASYRLNDISNFGVLMDYQISKDFRIGYAYDIPSGDLIRSTGTGSTHEVILIYELVKKQLGPVKSPRYF